MGHGDGSAAALTPARPEETDWLLYWLHRIGRSYAWDIATKAIFCLWFFYLADHVFHELIRYLDHVDRVAAPALFYSSIAARVTVLVFFLSFIAVTLLRSRPIAKAPGLYPRATAFFGTFLLTLLPLSPRLPLSVEMNLATTSILVIGNCLAIYVVCRLGRSFSLMAEARKIVTTGPYRYIRHPLYLAEEVAVICTYLQYASPWTTILVCVHGLLQLARMRNEEKLLSAALPGYADYMRRTARIIPGVY